MTESRGDDTNNNIVSDGIIGSISSGIDDVNTVAPSEYDGEYQPRKIQVD